MRNTEHAAEDGAAKAKNRCLDAGSKQDRPAHLIRGLTAQEVTKSYGQRDDREGGICIAGCRKHRATCNAKVGDGVKAAVCVHDSVSWVVSHTSRSHVVKGIVHVSSPGSISQPTCWVDLPEP